MSPSSPLTRKRSPDLGMLISASGVHGPQREQFDVLTNVQVRMGQWTIR